MIVEPYKLHPSPPALALLTADGQALEESGTAVPLRSLGKGVRVWASLERVNALLQSGRGRALCWRGRPIRYALDGRDFRVRVLALDFPPSDEQALDGLILWRDWLASEGAAPLGSLGSSSMSLLRATLEEPLHCRSHAVFRNGRGELVEHYPESPPIGFTLGGRQELGPRGAPAEYSGLLRHFDMRAAYASLLGSLEYGGTWFRIHVDKLAEHADFFDRCGKLVFCRARVRLPGTRPGLLVRRPRREVETQLGSLDSYPERGTLQGVWTYPELRTACELGARMRLVEGWVHNSNLHPFERWWRSVEQGRRMSGFAGLLAKATGNSLWGQFCISSQGRRQLLFYDRAGRRIVRELPVSGSRRPAHDLSEYLTGRVRSELTRFLVAAGDRLCSAHTDGGWVDCEDGWSYPAWRSKERADRLRVLDPQILAYVRPGEDVERYVVSGWPAEGAGELFEREWAERTRERSAA